MFDLVIKRGRIITAAEDFVGDVAVSGEKIAAIGQNLAGVREIDAQGLYAIPGAIDGHVHLQMPIANWHTADSFAQGTIAAACGGVEHEVGRAAQRPAYAAGHGHRHANLYRAGALVERQGDRHAVRRPRRLGHRHR